jgi:hypothetical protein
MLPEIHLWRVLAFNNRSRGSYRSECGQGFDVDSTNVWDLTRAEIEGRQQVFRL